MFIIKSIKKIINSKRIFFTTPSHSQGTIVPAVIKNLIGLKAFKADLSEVDGLDNIRNPQKCILKSQQAAAKIYGSKKTFYLFNGSSSGILAIMLSLFSEKDKILIARTAHESIYNGLVLSGATPIWFLPEWDNEFDIAKGITLEQIKTEYNKNPDIKGIIITSPTYEGVTSQIKEIAEFCKKNEIFFIVDEAHGALLPFSDKLPKSAIELGADACVQSLHKNTPALTGTALLHIGKNSKINPEIIQKNLNLLNSTSPSWLLIASIEGAINYLNSSRGKKELENLLNNIEEFKLNTGKFEFLNCKNQDKTKLLIKKQGIEGEFLSNFLSKNNIEDELVTKKAVLLLCGIGTTKKKFKKLSKILLKFHTKSKAEKNTEALSLPKIGLKPRNAHFAEFEIVESKNAIGRIIAENITPYPPCIPILITGEVIEEQHIKFLDKTVKVLKK